ncbi:4'-phosphopantetheinyl transferase family protein [Leptospira interrogans str. 2006001854]|uniref:4'-phosphopantetheinyl transferase family protein n=1 Tax=Leptospira interrogans str. 2006001854 TaxID=1001590 RepID=M6G8N0_LEPIR|nr:4'-phosphopantetheinyl transferase family protein [Leptospira interrogans str. 2006001854]
MKISVGNDIVENSRIRDLLEKHGDRFLKRVFSESEREYCSNRKDPIPHLSGRFCVKEAFIKAIEPGDHVILDMREIELFGKEFGKKNWYCMENPKNCFLPKDTAVVRFRSVTLKIIPPPSWCFTRSDL